MVFREKMFGAIAFNFFFKKPGERIKGLCWGSAFIVLLRLVSWLSVFVHCLFWEIILSLKFIWKMKSGPHHRTYFVYFSLFVECILWARKPLSQRRLIERMAAVRSSQRWWQYLHHPFWHNSRPPHSVSYRNINSVSVRINQPENRSNNIAF